MGENLGTYRVTYLSDKGKADDQVEFVDYLYSFEKVDGGQAADDIPVAKPIKSILEQLNELGKSIADFFIDLFGQNPEKSSSDEQGKHGDLIDASGGGTPATTDATGKETPAHGIVFSLRDQDNQFIADVLNKLPTGLGLEGKFPTTTNGDGITTALKFYRLFADELDKPTDVANYSRDAQLKLKPKSISLIPMVPSWET